jgi:hypothetical protein
MKKKSGNFFDKMSGQLVKNCFLSIYRHFPLWERKNSGNSRNFSWSFLGFVLAAFVPKGEA